MNDHDEPAPGSARDSERSEDLRATTDSIRQRLKRLLAIETEKRALRAEDPRVDELSDAAVVEADRIARETRAERQLADDAG
jgi:hypothetical protein